MAVKHPKEEPAGLTGHNGEPSRGRLRPWRTPHVITPTHYVSAISKLFTTYEFSGLYGPS